MSEFQLLNIDELKHYQQIFVGFSGGMDSTALLHALSMEPKLKAKLKAIHINHQISANAKQWQTHCESICRSLAIPLLVQTIYIDKQAQNLEEKARIARINVFNSMVNKDDCLVLGHHLNDQGETLLLNLFRGSGALGLSAMSPISKRGHCMVFRPLLHCTQKAIQSYIHKQNLSYIDDESNQDTRFSRNFLRQDILPQIKKKYPGLDKSLNRSAQLLQEQNTLLDELLSPLFHQCLNEQQQLNLSLLKGHSRHIQCALLRKWLQFNNLPLPNYKKCLNIVETFIDANQDKYPQISYKGITLTRFKGALIQRDNLDSPKAITMLWRDISKPLKLPLDNRVLLLSEDDKQPSFYLSPNDIIEVCYRIGGETIRINQQNKKLKKLFQHDDIPPWHRNRIPLIYVNGELLIATGHYKSDLCKIKPQPEAKAYRLSDKLVVES